MTTILSETFQQYGFNICVSDLRHGLDAFAHKLGKAQLEWDPILAVMANHNFETSARYGRDQNNLNGVPASVTESNAIR